METERAVGESILVVDDEPEIVSLVAYYLEEAGYSVSRAYDGPEALMQASIEKPALVILDLMLPGMSGFEVLEKIRADESLGDPLILMLTARREDADRIGGFRSGADDYVTKPFNPEELVLRVGAILRRTADHGGRGMLSAGPISANLLTQRASVDGREIDLTQTEYRLLLLLMQHAGEVLSRTRLLEEVWEAHPQMQTRTVDVHVQRLRAKLGTAGDMIETVRGSGYRLTG
ncbi:MAG TPA: response regulator transcription factor [Gemmatimonadaceae bacterium]